MTTPPASATRGSRESASKPRRQRAPWTMRRRLTVIVAALLVGASVLIGVVSTLSLRSFLVERLDAQLYAAVGRSETAVDQDGDRDPNRPDHAKGALLAPGQAAGTLVAVVSPGGVTTAGILENGGVTYLAAGQLKGITPTVVRDEPFNLKAGRLGEYRAIAVQNASSGDTLVVALPTAEVQAATTQLVLVIVLVTALGLAVTIIAGRFIIRHELRPLERVAATAQAVAALPLDRGKVSLAERVALDDTDARTEVGRVGLAVNTMLDHVGDALTARQASEEKVRQFVADASHELRTPLASIRGYSELTRRSGEKLSEPMTRALSRIESEAVRMTALVEDLLLLARLDEGRELVHGEVDLTAVVIDCVGDAEAADTISEDAGNSGSSSGTVHTWNLLLPDEAVSLKGDQARLHQVVANLLTNARIHTPAGTKIDVSLVVEAKDAVIRVRDNGPGIPKQQLETLFERFSRGDSSRTRATGSTGLGLSIVKAVVASHGGEVTVESRTGHTEFVVRLPR